jgi:hypothetical protein
MDTSYSPVEYVYKEVITEHIGKKTSGKVFYFTGDNLVDSAEGKIVHFGEVPGKGEFITLDPEACIRIDRIITLFGKPGAAFGEYDAYANACMDCNGGDDSV